MTDSFTLCWRSASLRLVASLACLLFTLALPLPAAAQRAAEITQLRLERAPDGIFLFANIRVELPPAVEDALLKGVPMFFVAEADVVRHRWYWTDKVVVTTQRHMRLAYHPLTRRWRLNVASGVITANSLGLALNLGFDSLPEAVAALQRLSGWKIADVGVLDPGATHKIELRFGLDLTQLPRPFQIGALGHSDWSISATASEQIGPEGSK